MAQTKEERVARNKVWRQENPEKVRSCYTKSARARYRTQKGRASALWYMARTRAKKADVLFMITKEWIEERLIGGVCEATGLPLDIGLIKGPYAPSLDRIEPSAGYTPDNCRMTITAFNLGKNRWPDDVLAHWAKAFLQQHDSAH